MCSLPERCIVICQKRKQYQLHEILEILAGVQYSGKFSHGANFRSCHGYELKCAREMVMS